MARVPGEDAARVYAAGRRFVDRCLRRNGSVFSARRRWAPDLLDDLLLRLRNRGDAGPFPHRWAEVLAGASDGCAELAAEACYVHVLFAADLAPATKRGLVRTSLLRSSAPPRVPADLDAALDGGLAGTGVAFKLRRLSQLRYLLEAARAIKEVRRRDREALLADPDAFLVWLRDLPCDGAYAQREALAHLVHPEAFEAIVSLRVKARIVAAYGGLGGDVDVALRALRAQLEPELGAGFAFVDLVDVRGASTPQRPTA